MNSSFSISDEMFESVISSVLKQGNTPSTKEPNAPEKLILKNAKFIKQIYDSYVKVGFTEIQAFDLLKIVLNNK